MANAGTNMTWNNLRRLTQTLYPPKMKVMSDLLLAGFNDCARFLSHYGFTDRALSCLTIESHLHHSQKQMEEVNRVLSITTSTESIWHILGICWVLFIN